MNSLDKMEDYDRLKQAHDALAAMIGVMREALELQRKLDYTSFRDVTTQQADAVSDAQERALSLTGPAALHEIRAQVLEEAENAVMSAIGLSDAVSKLREMAAAERAKTKRCEYCDGTGDVHRADGEWLGECTECGAAAERAKGEK